MIKNKKSQLGKGLVFVPILILLVISLTIYLFLASGITLLKKPSPQSPASSISYENNLLLQKVKIKINTPEKEFTVLDVFLLRINQKITDLEIKNALETLRQQTGKCYLLSASPSQYVNYFYSNRDTLYDSSFASKTKDKTNFLIIKLNNQDLEIRSYFGEC